MQSVKIVIFIASIIYLVARDINWTNSQDFGLILLSCGLFGSDQF